METLILILQKCIVLLAILWLVGLIVKTIWFSRVQRFKAANYFYSFLRWYSRPYFVGNMSYNRKKYMRFNNLFNVYTALFVLSILLLYFTKNIPL